MDLPWTDGIPHAEGANTLTFSGTTNREPFPGLNEDEKVKHKGELFHPDEMTKSDFDPMDAVEFWDFVN